MGLRHTIKKDCCYFLTLTVVEWLDVFTRKNHKDAILESLRYCIAHKGLIVHCYCLMTNHIHLIVDVEDSFRLEDGIRDFKRYTAQRIIEQIKTEPESRRGWMLKAFERAGTKIGNKHYKFWKTGNHAIELYSNWFIWEKINYIHNNPVKDGFVSNPEDWLYSSASNYKGEKGVLKEVKLLEKY